MKTYTKTCLEKILKQFIYTIFRQYIFYKSSATILILVCAFFVVSSTYAHACILVNFKFFLTVFLERSIMQHIFITIAIMCTFIVNKIMFQFNSASVYFLYFRCYEQHINRLTITSFCWSLRVIIHKFWKVRLLTDNRVLYT